MKEYGVNYFTPGTNNFDNNCGAISLSNITLTKQDNYKVRHKNDDNAKSILANLFDTFKPAIILCAIIIVVFELIIMNGFIPSESMEPTLNVGNGVVVNRLSYISSEPLRGDVIVFESEEYDAYLIKRVIGLPGDVIDLKDGFVYVNGCKLVESYAYGTTVASLKGTTHFEVPENSVFLLGDNREFSADSRAWGNPYISYDDIVGEATVQYGTNIKNLFVKGIDSIAPSFANQ